MTLLTAFFVLSFVTFWGFLSLCASFALFEAIIAPATEDYDR